MKDYQKQVVVNHNDNGADLMKTAYDGTNGLFSETLNLTEKLSSKIEQASERVMEEREKVVEEKTKGAMARVDTFTDQKGREINKIYGDYIEGSIAESFAIKTKLFEERQQLLSDISSMRLQLQEEKMNAELEIRKQRQDADLELKRVKQEIADLKKPSKVNKFWNIFCPFLGIGLGALTYVLLFILV